MLIRKKCVVHLLKARGLAFADAAEAEGLLPYCVVSLGAHQLGACVPVCVCVCETTTDLIGMCEIAAVELDSWSGQSAKWLALCQKEGAPPDPSLGEIQIAIRWEQQSYDA